MIHTKAREEHPLRARSCSRGGAYPLIRKNGWVVLFVLSCSLVFLHFSDKKTEVMYSLEQRLEEFRAQKAALLQENEDLQLQVNSQSDPAWIQLTLMKRLGLVPEGQIKVYFHDD